MRLAISNFSASDNQPTLRFRDLGGCVICDGKSQNLSSLRSRIAIAIDSESFTVNRTVRTVIRLSAISGRAEAISPK